MTEPNVRDGATTDATTGWPVELSDEYEFLGELGRGGMAVVYRARERALGREVAVKVVRPRFHADEEAVARLAREARTVAQLEHPNIVSLHAIKRLNNGLALVMQIVPGHTLKAALSNGGLPVDRAEGVLKDIARALAYAHRCGVVHRDVKPENIFLDEVTGRALLSDFGVARSITENTELTATGTAIGTPTYMSPEQIDGGSLDGRSDLYALGMVGWEMLTGQRPWMGESLYSVIYRQKHDALPPLDIARPDVPPRLQFLLEGLMAKKPDHRWPSAARFLTLLSSTDKLPGLKEWQSAARKRKKAGARGRTVEVRAVSPQSSTVQFRRGDTPMGTTPSSANEQSATASGEVPRLPSPWGQPTISVPFDQPERKRRWLPAILGLAGATTVALLAWMQFRPVNATTPTADSARFADAATVEAPFIAPPDTAVAVDSIAATGEAHQVDSAAAAIPPAAMTPPRQDSVRQPPTTVPTSVPTVTPATAPADSVKPQPAEPVTPAVAFSTDRGTIAAGARHSCMIDGDGRALCWGSNTSGQLGDGTFGSRRTPALVAGAFAFAFVSSGGSHTCGASSDGDAYCWGANESGQLGDGTMTPRNAPVRVSGSASFRVVRAGRLHTCGLTRSGAVQCWGSNARGQLGDGSRSGRSTPVSVALGGPAGAIAVGGQHTCALTRSGEALCWGRNDAGQLGDGTTTDHTSPVPVLTSERFISISAGNSHTCAVTTGGDAWCWGQNQYGQLGTGGTSGGPTPQRVEASGPFSTVAAGDYHTCARTADGRGFCWGRNAYGQVGDGSTVDRGRPVAIRGLGALSALNASGAHTCAVSGGEAYCWGYNVDGQLGSGDQESASAPARVAGANR
ncbi:MAG: protein kinase [Gemmatimonadaceae bacterium]|nr:protein kinase [Gemmatimonadaceae bacterium]